MGDVVAGKCTNCGLVTGDQVEFNFPQPGTCTECGDELEQETVVDETALP